MPRLSYADAADWATPSPSLKRFFLHQERAEQSRSALSSFSVDRVAHDSMRHPAHKLLVDLYSGCTCLTAKRKRRPFPQKIRRRFKAAGSTHVPTLYCCRATRGRVTLNTSLSAALSAARTAVIARSTGTAPAAPASLAAGQQAARPGNATQATPLPLQAAPVTQRPATQPAPTVQLSASPPAYQTAESLRCGLTLTTGAMRLHDIVHDLALHILALRAHEALPDALTFHLPAVILAAAVGYSERHLYRLADELRAAGLIDERGHVSQVGKLRRYDGTLWNVALKHSVRARLRWYDFRENWRPDFAEDYHGEKGAFREVQEVMSQPLTCEGKQARLQALAQTWAAATRTPKKPAKGGSDMRPSAALSSVVHSLPGLIHLHPRQRHREVSRLAADLAHALNEPGRLKQWAKAIYAALQAENELRPSLHHFASQVARLAADIAEEAPWRKPGAVLAARLR